jgi:hypothetical protein
VRGNATSGPYEARHECPDYMREINRLRDRSSVGTERMSGREYEASTELHS